MTAEELYEPTLPVETEPVLARVRAALVGGDDGYPDLETVATRLSMSTRTLKRRLNERGFGFRQLLDEVRRKDATRLLEDTNLSVEEVAFRLGYTAHSNFIRAFRSWTGTTPSAFRKHGLPAEESAPKASPGTQTAA